MTQSPFNLPGITVLSKIFAPSQGSNLVEDELGNVQLEAGSETVYEVFLKRPTKETFYLPREGFDSEAVELEGYLVNPMFFAPEIQPPIRLKCLLAAPQGGFIEGEFLLKITPGSTVGADKITGQKIQGVFTKNR